MAAEKLAALWVSQPDNLYYLTGCDGLEGYLLVSAGEAIIATDFRYLEQATRQAPEFRLSHIKGKMADWLPALLAGLDLSNLGFEGNHLSFTAYQQMAQILKKAEKPVDLVETQGLVDDLRMIKDQAEIENFLQAIHITEAALAQVRKIGRAGMTEKALSWEIEKFMRENHSQPVPFELIVAAGPNSALPHAKSTDYVIQSGEPIVVDIGAKYHYYGSDLTRTFCLGKPDTQFQKVYQTVLTAQQTAIAGIRVGMTGAEADAVGVIDTIDARRGENGR